MENLQENILKFGSQKDTSKLQELISRSSETELEELVMKLINSSVFLRIWDFILKAFQDSTKSHQKRIKVVLRVLNEMEDRECCSSHISSQIVQRLCMDLIKFKTEHLVEICSFCLKSIQSKKSSSIISWKDLLPDTLRILSEKDNVEFNELEYVGLEFKTTFINTLCMTNWSPGKVTQLTAMFSDMPLNKEEHLKVTIKLASYLEKLTPQEVPSFVYQLLRLCRNQNSRVVFLRLQHYFCLRIYNNGRFKTDDSPLMFDLIEDAEDHEILDAESMVLFHIQTTASIGHTCIKDYLNSLKNTVKSAEFIINPFQLLALFTISTVSQYEETVFDIIRQSVVRSYNEQLKKASSYWYRDIIPTYVEPEEVFKQIMNLGNREVLLEAFANFGFALLNVGSALGRDPIAEKQWTLGTMILLKIIKKKRNIASIVLKTFCNHVLTRSSATQYIECLYYLSKSSPLLMLENQSCLVEFIESLIQIPGSVANQLVEALIPLTKISPTIRDQFILILRKCLYSRSMETRQIAVYGFVKLISTLQISNGAVLSQNSNGSYSSGYSLYTQISLNRTSQSASNSNFSSEAICLEVLGILKRCFIQQYEVRMQLYEDLCNAVDVNPELGILILDVLWFHFMEYYIMDDESNPPLNFNNIAILREADYILQEPLGKFIFAISQILIKVSQSEDEKDTPTVKKYTDILNSLCNRMANCELAHFELDDGTDLTDPVPESQKKMFILKEVINVLEALIGYKFNALAADNENQCIIINSLFQTYSRFLHFGKNLTKPKKAKKNEKLSQRDQNKTTQKSTVKESEMQATSTRKVDAGSKTSSRQFKCPDTLLDLRTVEKSLKTLLESSVSWVTTNDANTIRTKTELHRHFISAALFLTGKLKYYKTIDNVYQKRNFDNITSIAQTLYNRVIKRLSDYIDFDCTSAVSSVECFYVIIQVINGQFKNNIGNFLSKVGGKESADSLVDHLKPLVEEFEKMFEMNEDELSNDPDVKKLSLVVLNNLTTLCNWIPFHSNVLSVQVYEWLKQIAYNNTVPSKVAGNFMNLFCEIHLRYKSGLTLFEHASNSFSDVFGTTNDSESIDETGETLKLVNPGSASAILLSLCAYNKNILDDVESIIARIKSEYCISNYPGENDDKKKDALKTKEKGATCQLCFVAKMLTHLMCLNLPPGNLADAVFKSAVQFYSCLNSLTKYFVAKSTKVNQAFQTVWFEKLVKLTGKHLGPAIYIFIYSMQSGGQIPEGETQLAGKKKSDGSAIKTKILRETKTIPKVVYEMEQFSKYIIQLTKKTKYDLSKYVGQGTTRDFRINLQNLKEDLKKATTGTTQISQVNEEESNGEEEETNMSDKDSVANEEIEESVSTPPPAKKLKR